MMRNKLIPRRKKYEESNHVYGDCYWRNGESSEVSISSSASSIFTISSRCSVTPAYCGHRCCRRRFAHDLIQRYCPKCRKKMRQRYMKFQKSRMLNRNTAPKVMKSEAVQIGSRSNILSPLYVTSNADELVEERNEPITLYSKITPEMIHDALCKLTMWKQSVAITSILDYLVLNFPVNNNKEALLEELTEKLNAAAMTGIACQSTDGTWSLSNKIFEKRKLTKNHVTLFWKIYADTLKPIVKKEDKDQDESSNNNYGRKSVIIYEENVI